MAAMSPLRRRMIDDMTVRNLSRSTQQSYLYAVAKFSRHSNRVPDQLGMEDVRAYQLHVVAQKRSWSHINQVACALRFFYGITLGHKEAAASPHSTGSSINGKGRQTDHEKGLSEGVSLLRLWHPRHLLLACKF